MTQRFKVETFDDPKEVQDWLNAPINNDYELTKLSLRSHGSGVLYLVVLECVKRDMAIDQEDDFAKSVSAKGTAIKTIDLLWLCQMLSKLAAKYEGDELMDRVKTNAWSWFVKGGGWNE